MPETISAQLLSSVPASDYDDVIFQSFPLQHTSDHHSGPGFTVIILYWTSVLKERPGIVSRFGELLFTTKLFDKGLGVVWGAARSARHRVLRTAI